MIFGWKSYGTEGFAECVATVVSMMGSIAITIGVLILGGLVGSIPSYFELPQIVRIMGWGLGIVVGVAAYLFFMFLLNIVTEFIYRKLP